MTDPINADPVISYPWTGPSNLFRLELTYPPAPEDLEDVNDQPAPADDGLGQTNDTFDPDDVDEEDI